MPAFEYVNPPFRLSRRAIETMLARIDAGACDVIGMGSMAVCGMSAPVTVAGAAVTTVAEILAGLTFFRLLRPRIGLRAAACAGAVDLRNGRVAYSAMRAHLVNLAAAEIINQGIGGNCGCMSWYRDANEPGMQALYEFGMVQAFFSGLLRLCRPEIGGLANGGIFSPDQAMLDIEACREYDEMHHGFCCDEHEVGMAEILAAGFDNTHHLTSDHTVQRLEDAVSFSAFFPRGVAAAAGHNPGRTQTAELLERARAATEEAVEAGSRVEPDHELSDELYQVVDEAARELGLDAPERM